MYPYGPPPQFYPYGPQISPQTGPFPDAQYEPGGNPDQQQGYYQWIPANDSPQTGTKPKILNEGKRADHESKRAQESAQKTELSTNKTDRYKMTKGAKSPPPRQQIISSADFFGLGFCVNCAVLT